MELGQEKESQECDKVPREVGDLYWEAGRAIQFFALGVVSIWGLIIGISLPSLEALLVTFLGMVPLLTIIGYTLEQVGSPPSPQKDDKSTSGNDHLGKDNE